MSQWPPFSRLSRLPRALLWSAILLVIALATLGKPVSWAAPVAHPPNQTVPFNQVTHLPLTASPLISTCDFYHYACLLTAGYPGAIMSYDWSPDGSTLAFFGAENIAFYGEEYEEYSAPGLYTMDEQGKNKRLLLELSNIHHIRYSPDSTMIALITSQFTNGHNIYDLYVYTLATGQIRLLADPASDDFYNLELAWSPDSSTLVFTRVQHIPTTADIYTVRADGSELRQLTNTPQNKHLPTYSPDGTRIAYMLDGSGGPDPSTIGSIAVMEADGSNHTDLTSAVFPWAYNPLWAADGKSIFFFGTVETIDWDFYKINVDGSDPVNLSPDALALSDPVLSPDGNQILFIGRTDTEAPETDFYTMNIDGSNVTKYHNPHGSFRHPMVVKWHPDGQRISYNIWTAEDHLYLLRLESGSR